jgi:isoaspartyl peptidase/L-asparaginase-like protein (Ntn-hydrolase superfamily)
MTAVCDAGALGRPALVVHGGAGTLARLDENGGPITRADLEDGLRRALDGGWEVLSTGGPALQAVVEAVARLESSGFFNAGLGSVRTTAGTTEMDASVMDGRTGRAGAVGAATWPANPVRAALAVALSAEEGGGWQPLLLVGPGADNLAREAGLVPALSSSLSRPDAGPGTGTVGAVAVDRAGHVAAATSTGGRAGQPPGRVGDSAVIGAGTWANDEAAAVSATGTGEAFIMAGFGHLVDWALGSGAGLPDALGAALQAVSRRGGRGGAIAITPTGNFAAIFDTPAMARGWHGEAGPVVLI